MNKITILLSASILLFSACQNQQKQEEPQNPNIIVVYMDDLGYGDMGAYGATKLKTPNMDKLAERECGLHQVMPLQQPVHQVATPCSPASIPGDMKAPGFCPVQRR